MTADEAAKLQRAAQPTRDRVTKLFKKVPERVRPLLREIRDHYLDPDHAIFQMRYEVEASDWQVTLLKRAIGMTPGELRQELCFETAMVLLRDTSLYVKVIARLVGYESVGSFRRRFLALSGMQPSVARAQLRLVVREQRALCDELFSWYFWVRYHRGELTAADYQAALDYRERRFCPS